MFEKEAEEWVKKEFPLLDVEHTNLEECITEYRAYQYGAEFGYNKANEWHYPSKGEYPKVGTWIIGFYYGKDNWHKIFYRTDGKWWGEGQLCQPPFAWKEIALPGED